MGCSANKHSKETNLTAHPTLPIETPRVMSRVLSLMRVRFLSFLAAFACCVNRPTGFFVRGGRYCQTGHTTDVRTVLNQFESATH